MVWAFASLTDIGVLCCASGVLEGVGREGFSPFDEVVVSTSGFPFSLFFRPSPYKCLYEESRAAPKYSALYFVSE